MKRISLLICCLFFYGCVGGFDPLQHFKPSAVGRETTMKEEKLITIDEQRLTDIVAEQNRQKIIECYAHEALEVVDGVQDSAKIILETSLKAIELYRKTKAYLQGLLSGSRAVPPDEETAECGDLYLKAVGL
jgi:hypothetical protein